MLLVSDCSTGSVEVAKVLKSARKVIEMSKLCFAIVESWSVCMRMMGCGVLVRCDKLIRRDLVFKVAIVSSFRRSRRRNMLFAVDFGRKVSREAENAYQTPKFGAGGRQSPPPPLSLRKEEGKRRVLLATGPAASFGTFSRKLRLCIGSWLILVSR